MKTNLSDKWVDGLLAVLLLLARGSLGATNDLSAILSKGLFEEEANHNLGAAIQVYQSVIDRFDTDRKLAATAVFRLGECYRKQGNTNEANVQYQLILREFADQEPLVTLSRQYLTTSGSSPQAQTAGQSNAQAESPITMLDVGEISRIESIIKNSPDLINAPNKTGRTLLQTYAGKGDLQVVKLLLDNGAVANGIKHPDLTPLHFAAGNGHKAVVELLLSKGAKAEVKTESGVTPVHLAVLQGYEQVAKVLLDAGASVNAAVTKDSSRGAESADDLGFSFVANQTPLALACWKGYRGLADLLISRGANVNTIDARGATPLTSAAALNDEELVKMLLAAKADPDQGTSSALALVAGAGNLPMLDLFLAQGTHTNLTAALEAAVAQSRSSAVTRLIQAKVDLNAKYPDGRPIIFAAIDKPQTLSAMLDGGADPNQRDPNGTSLLEAALHLNGKYDQQVEALLAHGADPNAVDSRNGLTALHIAATYGKTAEATLLLKHGAKVNAQNKDGQTPLHFAVGNQHQELTALLLENGADPNLRDKNDQTALDLAKQQLAAPGLPVRNFALPASQITQPNPGSIAVLLRQHGATEDLPHFDRIEVRRFPGYTSKAFSRLPNDMNRFSLLELLAVHYGFVSLYPRSSSPLFDPRSHTLQVSLFFPNLDKIEIRRPKPDGKGWSSIPVSARAILESGDCSQDVWLQWGDQVEIPEADHPLHDSWRGLPAAIFTNLQRCVQREVAVTVKGQSTNIVLRVGWPTGQEQMGMGSTIPISYYAPQFYLAGALQESGLMRTSSDLSRVKVTRHNPATGENWEKVLDCSGSTPDGGLWLRDGDIIEVPDKP